MVYAPLEEKESYYIEYEGEGQFKFVYYLQDTSGKPMPIFVVTMRMPVGGVGMVKEEVNVLNAPMLSKENALKVARVFLVPENMGVPPGAVALRGSTGFMTEDGWDTVFSPILNMLERPMAPMLVVRVESDWYAHDAEFRYVLQPGEGITVAQSIPIGQIYFVPREEITMRNCTDAELKTIHESQKAFLQHKGEATQQTSYGLTYSPHYLRQSRARKS